MIFLTQIFSITDEPGYFKRNQNFDEHQLSKYHCMFMIFADK